MIAPAAIARRNSIMAMKRRTSILRAPSLPLDDKKGGSGFLQEILQSNEANKIEEEDENSEKGGGGGGGAGTTAN